MFYLSIAFWFGVYLIGMHPDVCWGDGMGYALSVDKEFDWATNANSHFLYLNLNHLISIFLSFLNSVDVLRWTSLCWAIASLALVYQLGKNWKGEKVGLFALHGLAGSFTFWRHACIIEVYTFSTFFWLLCLFCLIEWQKGNLSTSVFCLVHGLGLLAHIQLILFFPILIWLSFRDFKPKILLAYGWYLVPVFVVCLSVFYLKTNDLASVFFDTAGEKMTSNPFPGMLKSLYFIPLFWSFLLAGPTLVFILLVLKWKPFKRTFWDETGKLLLVASGLNLCFCFLFPEPGIHVFMLPSFVGFCLLTGAGVANVCQDNANKVAIGLPLFQILFYLTVYFGFEKSAIFPLTEETKWKGGVGYYLLPWANGNASSVLQKFEESKSHKAPPELDWNLGQAKEWSERKN